MPITIRPETPADHAAIYALTSAAFPHSTANEAGIVTDLRVASALTLSLVAIDASSPSEILGHVAFSPVTVTPPAAGTWLGLGPISVTPERQRQGIGRQLIGEGLARIKKMGNVQGCVLLGDPKFYNRFGFEAGRGLMLAGVLEENFMSLVVEEAGTTPVGEVQFHKAFDQSLRNAVRCTSCDL